MTVLTSCNKQSESQLENSSITEKPSVTLTMTPKADKIQVKNTPKETKKTKTRYTVVIDAGHQKKQNKGLEPIGPGASEKKAKVSSGTQGRFSRKPEYEVNLEVSKLLQKELTNMGYRVVMIRETHDVNLSNKERADIANKEKADVFVRIHCNGSTNEKTHGILTMCPTKKNPYCSDIYKSSRKLAASVLKNIVRTSGAKNQGISETDSMSGINWSKVPVTIVEMGYMTNKEEDYLLGNKNYQKKLSSGIAKGIQEYLTSLK